MLYGFLLFIHIVVSVVLIVSVLLQSSKGGGLAGSFGGSGMSGGVFGGRGAAPFLIKITTTCAILFMVTSLTLNFISTRTTSDSVLERTIMESAPGSAPAVTDEMPVVPQSPDSGEPAGSAPAAGDGGAADQGGGQ